MKKLSFMLLSLLTVTMFSACNGNNDEPDNKQTITATISNRAIGGGNVIFSQGSAKVELNYTDMLIKITADYKDANGDSHSLITPDMKMSLTTGSVYTFNNTASSANNGIGHLEGNIDFSTGMMWYSFEVDGSLVVSTTHLLYAYTNTNMTNPENGNHGTHQQSAYMFALDTRGETCVMKIYNFMSNLNGAIDAPEVQFDGLTVIPTSTGYTITADEAESNYNGFYTLTDVHFTLDSQCLAISGSFKCNGINYEIDGGLFMYRIAELESY